MSMGDFPGGRWHGHWIAAELPEFEIDPTSLGGDLPPARFSRVQFRRTFEVATDTGVPGRVPLRISADSRYVLWVNGVEVGRGPIRSQPRRLRYDEYDIADLLRVGRNVIAVLVTYYGHANSFWQPAASSGVMGRDVQLVLEARLSQGEGDWLVTDAAWRASRSKAWRGLESGQALDGVPIELLDARELDPAWVEVDFDDSAWTEATVVKTSHDGGLAESRPPVDPYGAMLPRGIGMLGGERVVPVAAALQTAPTGETAAKGLPDHPAERLIDRLRAAGPTSAISLPITVARDADTSTIVTVDFGRIVAGHVELDIDAPAGVRLDLWYQESADYDPAAGPVESAPRASASYVTRGHSDRYKAVDVNGLRRIFLHIPSATEGDAREVTVRQIAVSEYHYPFTGDASFSSGDPELDRLYRAGIRTTEMNSFDAFTDCPTREQRAWVGDGVVHQMVHLVANEDWRLARNYVTLGASPRADGMLPMTVVGEIEHRGGYAIPDWALHWIHGVWNLFRHDGDHAATLSLLPVVERVLRWYEPYVDEHGTLSDVPEWNLIDWSSVFSSHRSALITGLWARGLAEYAEMADWLGNAASADWARAHWERIRQGFEDFWDPERGSYVDHIVAGERMPAMSQAAGAVAVVSGLAPQERWSGIVDVVTDPARVVVRSWIGGADGGYDMAKIVEQSLGIYRIDWDAEHEIVMAQPFFSYVVHDAVARAGQAERLPDLLRRWSVFLHEGYDTFGECWGWGTPVHAWSSTPTKDLIWYVLGVTPAEPGYASVKVAPRPGDIDRLSGAVPTPHGLVRVNVDAGKVSVDSPIPVKFVALDGSQATAPAGHSSFEL
ncbi:alpha-L-rhamnosidase-related protein [Streptomyces akebiae]|uniref:Alpha-L-rhamnosidase N-terminal domain-containing protein n=1 Tax=Streptomyces akebiae TaxID=2865673 RepID=A0ABX8XMS1_9ACTN|nr:alpha-L-rhamnosidase N-terminal domain-containing protein [Streptomyces akebiae]QYX76626.1 alpha-L-rhamnosidase N-terminal domain-containing protein [Streptomyces akebiae]